MQTCDEADACDLSRVARMGGCAVLSYTQTTNAAAIHAALQAAGVDAAVVDHVYMLSALQLAVALQRAASSGSGSGGGGGDALTARSIFLGLSLSHNLDRVLRVLPPGLATTAVVIVVVVDGKCGHRASHDGGGGGSSSTGRGDGVDSAHAGVVDATHDDVKCGKDAASPSMQMLLQTVHACVRRSNPRAMQQAFVPCAAVVHDNSNDKDGDGGGSSSSTEDVLRHTRPSHVWRRLHGHRVDVERLCSFYGVTARDVHAVRASWSTQELRNMCASDTASSTMSTLAALEPFCCQLRTRALLRVCGTDVHGFLQGLFTNDLRQLRSGGSLWGCFLFHTGRVMCDAYMYQAHDSNSNNDGKEDDHNKQASALSTVYVDVHSSCADELLEYLREMRMRRKVNIDDVSSELAVVASWQPPSLSSSTTIANERSSSSSNNSGSSSHLGECFVDARSFAVVQEQQTHYAPAMLDHGRDGSSNSDTTTACRVTTSSTSLWPMQLCKRLVPRTATMGVKESDGDDEDAAATAAYDTLLLASGVGEGPGVFRRDKTLPFEANTDFLGGVSFHKGCYVGQELTHRTHVMLVTRRRALPLVFGDTATTSSCARCGEGLYVGNGDTEKVGEVLAVCGRYGLGLMRLRYVDASTRRIGGGLHLRDGTLVSASIPTWWPAKQVRKLLTQGDTTGTLSRDAASQTHTG